MGVPLRRGLVLAVWSDFVPQNGVSKINLPPTPNPCFKPAVSTSVSPAHSKQRGCMDLNLVGYLKFLFLSPLPVPRHLVSFLCSLFVVAVEARLCCIAQTDLKLSVLLPQPSRWRPCSWVPPCPEKCFFIKHQLHYLVIRLRM